MKHNHRYLSLKKENQYQKFVSLLPWSFIHKYRNNLFFVNKKKSRQIDGIIIKFSVRSYELHPKQSN